MSSSPRRRTAESGRSPAPSAVERIIELLDTEDTDSTNTSMRIPTALRDAAAIVVNELGAAPSTTALTNAALRATIEAVVMQTVLDEHYARHPHTRPSLADRAIAAAEMDGHPLASKPARLRRAAAQIVAVRPDADADDVLLWAEAQGALSA